MSFKPVLSLLILAFLSTTPSSEGAPLSSVTNPTVSQITIPAKRALTVVTFVQPGSYVSAERRRIVVTKDGASVTVRVANLSNVPDEAFSGQVVIAGPATLDIIGPTSFLTYKLQAN